MFIAFMLMHRNTSLLPKPDQGSRWPANSISVQAMNIDSVSKGLPGNSVNVLANVKNIFQFQTSESRGGIRFHNAQIYTAGITRLCGSGGNRLNKRLRVCHGAEYPTLHGHHFKRRKMVAVVGSTCAI